MGNQSDKKPPQQQGAPQRQVPGQQHQQQAGQRTPQQGDPSRRDDRR